MTGLGRLRGMLAAVLCLALSPAPAAEKAGMVTVGSKNFSENRLLGEMFAQLLEARTGLTVKRTLGLAGTQVCFEALKSGAIDVYPEYTGTGAVTMLGSPPNADPTATLALVRREFLARWDLWWLAPLGFENTYALAVPRALARKRNLRTISDLARVAGSLKAGLGYEFVEREDGLPGLERAYGLAFGEVRTLQQALKYQAVHEGHLDCLDVYSTDGRLMQFDLQVLEDDQAFFPAYEAAALVRGETLERHPEMGAVLGLLANALNADTMRRLNQRIEHGGESETVVARNALAELGLLEDNGATRSSGGRKDGLWSTMVANRGELAGHAWRHLQLAGLGVLLGIAVAIPLGLWLEHHRNLAETVIRIFGMSQTIPSIALLAFMVPLFGVGVLPALVALWIYSLFPILRNTYTGVRDADAKAVASAESLGMTRTQVLTRVRLPLAAPVIMAGIRTSAVITIGTATLAAFIGAGGLGVPIVSGLQMADSAVILSGAVPAALLALAVDGMLAVIEFVVRPRGLRPGT